MRIKISNSPSSPIAADCRHYLGDRPCVENRLCPSCNRYEPFDSRICVVKLGALGDVIRTLCILPSLKEQYPNSQITWVTRPNAARMIQNHHQIERVVNFDAMAVMPLLGEQFDLVICLDKEPEPCSLAMSLQSPYKLGVGLSSVGTPIPFNDEAVDYFQLGLSDELKFNHNTQSYPQLVYGALGWSYEGQRYELPLDDALRESQMAKLGRLGWNRRQRTLGINVGAGAVFANKMWPGPKQVQLIEQLKAEDLSLQIILLGGPDERPTIDQMLSLLQNASLGEGVFDGGTENSEMAFVALVSLCDALFSGDTMAMHVAIALEKQVVAFFGPTCEQEITLFGRGEKLVAQVPCGPCYKRTCNQSDVCLDAVEVGEAVVAIGRVLKRSDEVVERVSLPVLRQAS